ncbi:Hypothetical predicted protein [Octopus vulgaris]|uniref:Uncharacterized protein n=1 Tax=Octopus vulgaris TaxID=6645 RepID=A0AA36FJU1_OCTVU|nr:Hypothetical predicted protein [Octopus vulgaris]
MLDIVDIPMLQNCFISKEGKSGREEENEEVEEKERKESDEGREAVFNNSSQCFSNVIEDKKKQFLQRIDVWKICGDE